MGGWKEIAPSEISEQLKAGYTGACSGSKGFILECPVEVAITPTSPQFWIILGLTNQYKIV